MRKLEKPRIEEAIPRLGKKDQRIVDNIRKTKVWMAKTSLEGGRQIEK